MIGGCPRSGTTLLRCLLGSHPNIGCEVETRVFHRTVLPKHVERLAMWLGLDRAVVDQLYRSSTAQAQFVERLFAEYCRVRGKPRWAEKTPDNVKVVDYIFEHFPRAKFVHGIRDGRDVVCSFRTHPSAKIVGGVAHPVETRRSVEHCARRWTKAVAGGLRFRGHPGYHEVRYEDLVAQPEEALRELLTWAGEPWDDAVLQPIYSSAIGRWRDDLTPDEAETVVQIAGPLLAELGYAEDASWVREHAMAH